MTMIATLLQDRGASATAALTMPSSLQVAHVMINQEITLKHENFYHQNASIKAQGNMFGPKLAARLNTGIALKRLAAEVEAHVELSAAEQHPQPLRRTPHPAQLGRCDAVGDSSGCTAKHALHPYAQWSSMGRELQIT